MTLANRRTAYADCRAAIHHAFERATQRGLSLSTIVVLLIDETSVWSVAKMFANTRPVDIVAAGRRRSVWCVVVDRAAIIAVWRTIYPRACATIEARLGMRNTMVLGFDDPSGATLFCERPWPSNDSAPDPEELDT